MPTRCLCRTSSASRAGPGRRSICPTAPDHAAVHQRGGGLPPKPPARRREDVEAPQHVRVAGRQDRDDPGLAVERRARAVGAATDPDLVPQPARGEGDDPDHGRAGGPKARRAQVGRPPHGLHAGGHDVTLPPQGRHVDGTRGPVPVHATAARRSRTGPGSKGPDSPTVSRLGSRRTERRDDSASTTPSPSPRTRSRRRRRVASWVSPSSASAMAPAGSPPERRRSSTIACAAATRRPSARAISSSISRARASGAGSADPTTSASASSSARPSARGPSPGARDRPRRPKVPFAPKGRSRSPLIAARPGLGPPSQARASSGTRERRSAESPVRSIARSTRTIRRSPTSIRSTGPSASAGVSVTRWGRSKRDSDGRRPGSSVTAGSVGARAGVGGGAAGGASPPAPGSSATVTRCGLSINPAWIA